MQVDVKDKCFSAWEFLSDLDEYYPRFHYWFLQKVCPDITTGNRKIILKESNGIVIAAAILKRHTDEKKICTFRVSKAVQGSGVGTELMLESLHWLKCKQPLITVNEENVVDLSRFLTKFQFTEPAVVEGLYRLNKKEYIYGSGKIS